MNETARLPRSPELMSPADTAMLVVDVQEKLIELIHEHDKMVWNIGRLIDGAAVLDLPVAATEQYPQGLGPTIAPLAERVGERPEKLTFSCGGCPQIFEQWRDKGVFKVLVVGIETHVCVQQTVLDLLAEGFRVYVAVDAVGSRNVLDMQTALRRMESSGAVLTTTESALFEWCDIAGTPRFKEISRLVRQTPPQDNAPSGQ